MHEKFLELSEEKQLRIINAAMDVFSKTDYNRAVTDDIAAKAGISKGSLFYYFQNKKALYLYIYDYAFKEMMGQVADTHFEAITDFFELLEHSARIKLKMLVRTPYLLDFYMRCFYPEGNAVAEELNTYNQDTINSIYQTYFNNIDFSKFKEGSDPIYMLRMFVWMADGYLHEKKALKQEISLEDMMAEFHRWVETFRPLLYKEEYL